MTFTKEEYERLADRLNALPFADQLQRAIDNPNVLEVTVTFRFKDVPDALKNEVGDILKLNIADLKNKFMELKYEPEFIIEHVAVYLGTCRRAVLSPSHTATASEARHIAIYLCRMHCGLTPDQVGELFGRDRTIVYYAQATIIGLIKVEKISERKLK